MSNPAACRLKNATLIYNPVSGRRTHKRENQIREAARILEASGITVRIESTSWPSNASTIARAAADRGDDLILVCGGDGTINEVINGITPGRATLGVLPGGTANILANELGLPRNLVRAARELPSWTPRRIALGRAAWTLESPPAPAPGIQRRYFLSVAGVGFDAHVVRNLTPETARSWGVAAYVVEAVRQCLKYRFPRFFFAAQPSAGSESVETASTYSSAVSKPNGVGANQTRPQAREGAATFAVLNRTSLYAGWLKLAPAASLWEDSLSLCTFKSRSRARYFVYAAAVVARRHHRLPDVDVVKCQRVELKAESSPVDFELDGEWVGRLPASFEIVPDALTLLAPPPQPGRPPAL